MFFMKHSAALEGSKCSMNFNMGLNGEFLNIDINTNDLGSVLEGLT